MGTSLVLVRVLLAILPLVWAVGMPRIELFSRLKAPLNGSWEVRCYILQVSLSLVH